MGLYRIIKERGEGKTTELIKISAEKQIPIVVFGKFQVKFVSDLAEEMGLRIPKPIYVKDIYNHIYDKEVLVDEADHVLQELMGCKIYASTITKPKKISKTEAEKHGWEDCGDFEVVDDNRVKTLDKNKSEVYDTSLEKFLHSVVRRWDELSPETIRDIEKMLPTGYDSKMYEIKVESMKPQ